jgi:hypothetical protein
VTVPPADVPAVNDSVAAVVLVATTESADGTPDTPAGVTEIADDAALIPSWLMDFRRIEYVVPLVSPVMETGDVACAGENDVYVLPPSSEYWWLVIAYPLVVPATKAICTFESLVVATNVDGAPGAAPGVTDTTAAAASPSPAAFVPFKLMVYAVPFVSPEITTGEDDWVGENAMYAPPLSEYI